jgi:hypothetical protein
MKELTKNQWFFGQFFDFKFFLRTVGIYQIRLFDQFEN